ncbi:antirestriction protein ArdA [Limosilactobacillus fermentum]|uniref:antirestriction protein ArdA n=1 Tax=Limosilactobacillus fermentum TaxID=1613 RepID=UPI001E651302|nr:antirestriction protein ArdA [Limosilactobacillus fermentum]MCD5424426.1 antirestriction protein ArdA [Limosilactobacillus fermentum]
MEIKVFVSNLAKYNEGELNGQWTSLPVEDVNRDILDKIDLGGDSKKGYAHDWFVSDYEAPFKIEEYEDLYALNELAEALKDYDTIEDVYNALDDREATGCEEVYDFDDEFFDTMFSSKQEVARAVFFGDIHNWLDPYIFLNGYGNCESMTEYDYQEMLKDNADEIIEAFKNENV